MRKMFLLALAAIGLTAGSASAQSAKIGYIDSQKILAEAPGAAEVRTTIQREMNKHRADLALADDSLKNMINEYEKKRLVLSAEARTKEEEAIRARSQALQNRAAELEEQMAKRQSELAAPIMQRINTVLQELRQQGGYVVILDAAAGGIVAADPAADLTEQVLTRLKAMAAASPSSSSSQSQKP